MSDARVSRVNGPVVEVTGAGALAMLELVLVGDRRLPGEVIARRGDGATVQVYEYTGGLRPGARVTGTGAPLVAALGPGLLGGVFDGMLRGLDRAGDWLEPGVRRPRRRSWEFVPAAGLGPVAPGALLGTVQETPAVEFRVLVPPRAGGRLEWLASGDLRPDDPVARIDGREITLAERWISSSRSRSGARRRFRAGSGPGRRCCCSRSRSTVRPT